MDANWIYVANAVNNSILVFPIGASGGPAPTSIMSGVNTTLNEPAGIAVDPTATSVPTMSEWGMIIFIVLADFGSIYYLRRQKRANG